MGDYDWKCLLERAQPSGDRPTGCEEAAADIWQHVGAGSNGGGAGNGAGRRGGGGRGRGVCGELDRRGIAEDSASACARRIVWAVES